MKSSYKYSQLRRVRPYVYKEHRKKVSQERLDYLWGRVRIASLAIGRLNKMSQDIQLFGANKHVYSRRLKRETFDFSSVSIPSWVVNPKSAFSKIWAIVILLLILYTAIITPYVVAFVEKESEGLEAISYTIDILFFVDIILNFFTPYLGKNQKMVVKNSTIACHYLKTWFLLDLIACIPFDLINSDEDSDEDYNKLIRLLRLPRFSKLIRILRLVKLVRFFKSNSFISKIFTNYEAYWSFLNLVKFCVMVLITVHIIGCFWALFAYINIEDPDNWMARYGYIDSDNLTVYITATYWVFTTLTTVGYGDIVPFTKTERTLTIILMAFGVAFYSYTISKLSSIMMDLNKKKTEIGNHLSCLNEFARSVSLPNDLRKTLRSYIKRRFKDSIIESADQEALLNEIPTYIRTKVLMHMHYEVVEKVFFLQDKDPHFIAYIVPKLKPVFAQRREILYRKYEDPEEIYFITKGNVDFLAENELAFCTYITGSYFGEIEVLSKRKRICTVRTSRTASEFLVMTNKSFMKMLEEFPKIEEEIKEIAWYRALKTQEGKDRVKTMKSLEFNVIPFRKLQTGISPLYYERRNFKAVEEQKRKNKIMWRGIIDEKKLGIYHESEENDDSFEPQAVLSNNHLGSKLGIVQKAIEKHPISKKLDWHNLFKRKTDTVEFGMNQKFELFRIDLPVNNDETVQLNIEVLKNIRKNLYQHRERLDENILVTRNGLSLFSRKLEKVAQQIKLFKHHLRYI